MGVAEVHSRTLALSWQPWGWGARAVGIPKLTKGDWRREGSLSLSGHCSVGTTSEGIGRLERVAHFLQLVSETPQNAER